MTTSMKTTYVTIDPCAEDQEKEDQRVREALGMSLSMDMFLDDKPPREQAFAASTSCLLDKAVRRELSSRTLLPADCVPWHGLGGPTGDLMLPSERRNASKQKSIDNSKLQRKGKGSSKPIDVKAKKQEYANRQKKKQFFATLNFADPEDGCSGLNSSKINNMMDDLPNLCQDKYLFSAFPEPITALHMLCAVDAPIACIKKCFKYNPEALQDASSAIGSPLHYASWFNADPESVRYICSRISKHEYGIDSALQQCNRAKRTPLHLACLRQSDADLVILLTEACPNAAALVDKDKMNPLHLALSHENPMLAVVEDLTEVFSNGVTHRCSLNGSTPLHLAICNNASVEILKDLILSNVRALKVKDDDGYLPLHMAVSQKLPFKKIKIVFKKYSKAANIENDNEETPYEMAKLLLPREKDVLNLLMPTEEQFQLSMTW